MAISPTRIFAVVRARGSEWDDTRPIEGQTDWEAHASFMDALALEGFVAFAGPLDGAREALLIVRARDEEQVRTRLAEDPWARNGLLSVSRLNPWTLRIGSI